MPAHPYYLRILLCLVLLTFGSIAAQAQYIYKIKADTVRIYNTCDTAELVLQNRTQNVLGYLYNKGGGVTEFRALGAVDSMYRRNDTLFYHTADGKTIPVKMDLSNVYDLKATNFVSVAANDSANLSKLPIQKVVGVGATNALDMPPLSNQAYYGANSTLYYQGFAVTDGASAVNMMVNWNGELKGPNGAFIRIKDDNRTTWSSWRELVFKDFSDSIYARSANVVSTALPTFYGQDWNSFNGTTKAGFVTGDINAPTASMLYFGLNMPNTTNQYGAQLAFRNGTGFFRTLEAGGYGSWLQLADRPWTNAGFIQNQNTVAQTASNFWISGNGAVQSLSTGNAENVSQFMLHISNNAGNNIRWTARLLTPESTADAGSDLAWGAYTDAGVFRSQVMTLKRSNGFVGLGTATPAERLHVIGNIKTSGSLLFDKVRSDANLLVDFQQGYQLYCDTVGALAPNGTRLWLAGPDRGSVVFGPRAGPSYLNVIRVKADTFHLEGNGGRWNGIASLGTDVNGNLINTAGSFIQNQNAVAQATSNFWISGQGAMKSLAVAAPNDNAAIVYHTGSYVSTQANRRWTQYLRAAEGALNKGSDLVISRYDSVGNFISEAITIQRATGNVGVGTVAPVEKLDINGNIRSTGSLLFDRPLSGGNILLDLQQGYQLYSDTLSALNAGGTRLWFAGPDKGSIVFSPRAGAYYFNMIRMRADSFRLEGNGTKWFGITSLGTDAYGNLINASGSVIQNQNATVQASANYVISGRGTSQSLGTFQASAGPPHWVLFNGSNANTAVRWSVSMKNTESTNNNGADLTIDRYDSTGTIIDNVLFAKRSTGYIGIGTSSPAQKLDVNGVIKANSLVTYGGGASATAYGHYWLGNSSGITRWRLGVKGLETGSSNVGSDFDISPYTDAGNVNTSVSAFTIQRSTGNVGINNASPSQKLDVTGSIYASASVITPAVTAPTASSDLTLQAGTGSAINVNSMLRVSNSVQLPQKTVSAPYTLTSADYTIFCNASSATLTLPAAASSSGRVYEIVNASSGNVTISAVQVYATATTSIPTNTSWRIQSDGTNWRLVFRSS